MRAVGRAMSVTATRRRYIERFGESMYMFSSIQNNVDDETAAAQAEP